MSRRTKLLITTLFLVLLAIPMGYTAYTWHPANPLRFRYVMEYLEDDIDGRDDHWIRMEVRNTSDVTVTLLAGEFHGIPGRNEEPLTAEAHVAGDLWQTEIYAVPPGGTLEVEFSGQSGLSADTIKSLKAGEWHSRKGSVQYAWLSRSKVRVAEARLWVALRIPPQWGDLLPGLHPFVDTTDVEPAQQEPAPQ